MPAKTSAATRTARRDRRRAPLALLLWPFLGACSLFGGGLPQEPPALADMEEPLDLRAEPDDEAARLALPAGSFSGLYVEDARDTLAAKLAEPDAVEVARVVENSPAALAGLAPGDQVLEVTCPANSPLW